MSSTESLANRIAQLLEGERASADLSALHSVIEKINERLDRLEAINTLGLVNSDDAANQHPSQVRFAVPEPADAVTGESQDERICTFEPHGRPCDHCSMCSAQGF